MQQADQAGLEPPDLEPLESDQMPWRGLAHQADGTPTAKTQRTHRSADGFAYTDPDSHIMKGVNGDHRWSAQSPTPAPARPPSSPTLPIGVRTTWRSVQGTDRCPHRHRPPEARPTATGLKRPDPEGFGPQRSNGPQVAHQQRSRGLCQEISDPRTRLWPDQRNTRLEALPPAWPGEGEWGLDAVGHHPQHPQVTPFPEGSDSDGNGIGSIPPTLMVGGNRYALR